MVGSGAHGPAAVVEVEDRDKVRDIQIGFIVGIQRADIAPVEGLFLVFIHKVVGLHTIAAEQLGQDVMAEIMLGIRVLRIPH